MDTPKADCVEASQRKMLRSCSAVMRTVLSLVRLAHKKSRFGGGFAQFCAEDARISLHFRLCGGEGGIRTPGTLSGTPVFKTGAFNHSATSPIYSFTTDSILWQR